jgi:hypothetical protein
MMADASPQCSSIANADSAHNSAKGSSNSTSNGHKLLIVIERKLLSFIAYRHQASNEFVVALDRLSYRAIVRRSEANGLHARRTAAYCCRRMARLLSIAIS